MHPTTIFTTLLLTSIFQYFDGVHGKSDDNCCHYKLLDSGKSDSNQVLQLHNKFRKDLSRGKVPGQPRAANMKKLKWDAALASTALDVAEICLFEHLIEEDSRFKIGQNLYISCGTNKPTTNWKNAVTAWYDEHTLYTYSKIVKGSKDSTGHYTQLMWADTDYVGCAYSHFEIDARKGSVPDENLQQMALQGMKYCKLYVCNYGPAGNIVGQKPYKLE